MLNLSFNSKCISLYHQIKMHFFFICWFLFFYCLLVFVCVCVCARILSNCLTTMQFLVVFIFYNDFSDYHC